MERDFRDVVGGISRIHAIFQFYFHAFRLENFEKKEEFRMLIFLHQKYEIKLRNLFRIFEKNWNRKRSTVVENKKRNVFSKQPDSSFFWFKIGLS